MFAYFQKKRPTFDEKIEKIIQDIDIVAKDILENKLVISEEQGEELVCRENSAKKISEKLVFYYKNELQKLQLPQLSKTAINLGLLSATEDILQLEDKEKIINTIVDFYSLKYSFLLELRNMKETCVRHRNAISKSYYKHPKLRLSGEEKEFFLKKLQILNQHTETYIQQHAKLLDQLKRDISLEELKNVIRQGKVLIDQTADACYTSILELYPLAFEFDAGQAKYVNIVTNEVLSNLNDLNLSDLIATIKSSAQTEKKGSYLQFIKNTAGNIKKTAKRKLNLYYNLNPAEYAKYLETISLKDKELCDDSSIKKQFKPIPKKRAQPATSPSESIKKQKTM